LPETHKYKTYGSLIAKGSFIKCGEWVSGCCCQNINCIMPIA
jgi:hypothetical protein